MRRTRIAHLLALGAAAVAVAAAAASGTAATPTCSAATLSPKLPHQELPATVAAARDRIAAAAVRCDYAALARIARESPAGFAFSFGGGTSPAAYWRKLETEHLDRPLAKLVQILRLPGRHSANGLYTWPSAYSGHVTARDWRLLGEAGVYTQAQVASMKRYGAYLGYRTAIGPAGRWRYFVAGD